VSIYFLNGKTAPWTRRNKGFSLMVVLDKGEEKARNPGGGSEKPREGAKT